MSNKIDDKELMFLWEKFPNEPPPNILPGKEGDLPEPWPKCIQKLRENGWWLHWSSPFQGASDDHISQGEVQHVVIKAVQEDVPKWWKEYVEKNEKKDARIKSQKDQIKGLKKKVLDLEKKNQQMTDHLCRTEEQMESRCAQNTAYQIENEELTVELSDKTIEKKEWMGCALKYEFCIEKIKQLNGFNESVQDIVDSFEYIDLPETTLEERDAFVPTDMTGVAGSDSDDESISVYDSEEEESSTSLETTIREDDAALMRELENARILASIPTQRRRDYRPSEPSNTPPPWPRLAPAAGESDDEGPNTTESQESSPSSDDDSIPVPSTPFDEEWEELRAQNRRSEEESRCPDEPVSNPDRYRHETERRTSVRRRLDALFQANDYNECYPTSSENEEAQERSERYRYTLPAHQQVWRAGRGITINPHHLGTVVYSNQTRDSSNEGT